MDDDFLNRPLGGAEKRSIAAVGTGKGKALLLGSVLGVAVVGLLGWRLGKAPPDPGTAVARIEPAKPAAPVIQQSPPPASSDDEVQNGIRVVRPPGAPAAAGPAFIKVPQDLAVALQHAPDLRLVEKTRFGLLPQRGADGSRPAEIYARPVVTDAGLPSNAPRVAILVGGMGLNASLTAAAATELPPAVTLGFAPYGDDLDRQVQAARDAGHEAVLQVPMEGFGDPASASMSHLLSAGLDSRELMDRLHWHMGRFTGYVAIANFLGGKFTADAQALTPVLRDAAARGLFFIDDASSPRSLAPTLAPGIGLPLVRADVVIDADGSTGAVETALGKLEARARERGFAVGVAGGLPATIGRIASFAQKLSDRGIALVPVSALVAGQALAGVTAPRH